MTAAIPSAKLEAPAAATEGTSETGFRGSKIRELKDVLVGELAERGEWVVANVETKSFWPVNAQKQTYRGETIWILPLTQKHFAAIAMKVRRGTDRSYCERLLLRFLSGLSWVMEYGMMVDRFTGGSRPMPMGRERTFGLSVTEDFDLSYFPEPNDERALLALALMREGRGLNHPGYAFLSFYRVLEVAFPNGRARGEWITRRLSTISDRRAKEALAELASQGIADIGAHLYVSGRRAMAHARDEPIIDPDDPADARRLSSELPIMSSLATLAIEEVFGVETRHAVYEKHLYELAGFKKVLGTDLVKRITSGAPIAPGTIIDLPRINVRLRLHPPFAPLENLHPVEIHQNKSVLFVRFQSDDRNLQIQFHLDFASERLQFNMFHDVAMRDSGTADGALALLGFGRFRNAHFCNGQLEIYDAESNALLARKDAYVPLNMYFEPKGAEEEIARLEKLAEERRRWEVGSVFVAARGEIKSTHRSFETYGIRVRLDIE